MAAVTAAEDKSTYMPEALYLHHDEMFETSATVVEVGTAQIKQKTYYWIRLDQTIFYPQGGGQLSDIGTINDVPVDYVHRVNSGVRDIFQITHCFEKPIDFAVGSKVVLKVDAANRLLNSRWHTAAHVIGHIIETTFAQFKPFGGECFPGQAHMKFRSEVDQFPSIGEVQDAVKEGYARLLQENPPIRICSESMTRELVIGKFTPVGCGGTHVYSIKEIGKELTAVGVKWSRKKGEFTMSVKYSVAS